jgi:protein-disulfide isomerase
MERDSPPTRRAVLAGVGALLAGGGVVYGASRLDSGAAASAGAPFHASNQTTGFGIDLRGHPIMGALDAPIDLYYWSDYQCPFCRRFERETFPRIVENYVRPGTVRVVFIEYPYLGEASTTAAVMDRCVWRQVRAEQPRRYWRWHSRLFDEQGETNAGWASRANLLAITNDVGGVDSAAVEECLRARRDAIEASIAADVDRASALGIRGSPAFVLYNREAETAGSLVGAQPYDRFDDAITTIRDA